MSGDLGTSIILTMAPIFVAMIALVAYGAIKNSNKNKGRSKHESDALIEAQAMLAKYQKEQAEKQAKADSEKKEEKTTEKAAEKSTEKAKEKPEEKSKGSKAEKPKENEKKDAKPNAEAPISDTTELEPDIDKAAEK